VATLHATLLEGFQSPRCPVDAIGVVPPASLSRELPLPVFARPPDESTASFYERLLAQLEPDVVLMHHFAHTIGLTHARMGDAPPAIGVAHSWHNVTFCDGEERERAWETTQEALAGLRAIVGMSRHCLREGRELGLRYPAIVETIYHPLQPLYSTAAPGLDVDGGERQGVACLGSLIPRKRPEVLVEAAARVPGLGVVFAGHGECEDRLRALISARSLDARVEIQHLDDTRVRELLYRSEAMCLPSCSETFGLAYAEALACGTPVIGFGPTLREIRDEVGVEIGETVDTGGPDEVVAAIERVLDADWDRAELRRRTLAAFDLPAATERYADLIARVVDAPDLGGAGIGPAVTSTSSESPEPPSGPICVLGMSRTGSSLTARVLNLMGVYLGPEEELLAGELRQLAGEGEAVLARANEANPNGFWEHYRIMRLNERILRVHGGSWRDPPSLPPGWERSAELESEREEARALLAESFGGRRLWGWKDPRNSLTLPFWQHLQPDMRYVICLRNPLDVAISLQRRDGMPLEQGFDLWLTYLASALVNTSGRPRILVPYESYFEAPGELATRLAGFLGHGGTSDEAELRRRLAEAVDEQLWRNRTPLEALAADGRVPDDALSLHLLTQELVLSPEGKAGICDGEHGLHEIADRSAARLLAVGGR
jgi:glycosyltransferase involved in cell wall biosynthesis